MKSLALPLSFALSQPLVLALGAACAAQHSPPTQEAFFRLHQAVGHLDNDLIRGCGVSRTEAEAQLLRVDLPEDVEPAWATVHAAIERAVHGTNTGPVEAESLRAELHELAEAAGLEHDPAWRDDFETCRDGC